MTRKSTDTHYGNVAITIHWLSALSILALLGSGFWAAQTTDLAAKADILKFHAPIGIMVLILTIMRIVWWWWFDKKPAEPTGSARWQIVSAKIVHAVFYVIILGMAASGIGMFALSGAGAILFGDVQSALPDFNLYPPRLPHGLGARAMVALLVLHTGAALYHHLVKRDATLKRMWFTR